MIAALTFGTMGSDGFQFMDDLMQTGRRNIFYGFAGGAVFNLANMLLVAAISVAGMAVAFPVGIGMALVIGVVWNYFIKPQGNPVLLFGGAAIIVGAIIMDSFAYKAHAAAKLEQQAKALKRSKGGIIRDLIHQQQAATNGSLGQALADLRGCLKGSKDLSTPRL